MGSAYLLRDKISMVHVVRACVTAVTSDPERGNRITQKIHTYMYDRRIQDPGRTEPPGTVSYPPVQNAQIMMNAAAAQGLAAATGAKHWTRSTS